MKSVFITIVGRPNVGKSTLTNKLVNEKVAIVSDKAGTTRDQIKGIVNINENQFIFVDTPGIHKPKHLLGEHMTNIAIEALENVDLIMFMLDGTKEISTGDMFVNEHIRAVNTPIVAIINKIDKMTDAEIEEKKVEIREKLGDFDEIITLTAEYGIGVHKIFDVAKNYLSNDMWFYPEDYYTDLPVNKIVVETIREKILHHTKDEIPHSVAVEIINVETKKLEKRDGAIYIKEKEDLVGAWCTVYRKDWTHPITKEVNFDEYIQKKQDGTPNTNWENRPVTMITKVAIVQALREAFIEELSGMYEAEEMGVNESELDNTPIQMNEHYNSTQMEDAEVINEDDEDLEKSLFRKSEGNPLAD